MKSKKPFLIVCAAALTLAVAFPFMGLFTFAEEPTYRVLFLNSLDSSVAKYSVTASSEYGSAEIISSGAGSYDNRYLNVVYKIRVKPSTSSSVFYSVGFGSSPDSLTVLSTDVSNPTPLNIDLLSSCSLYPIEPSGSISSSYYFVLVLPPPPDPFAPVSDGMDTMISLFGDVIDYIINTPDVAIFVAISVASCAIIPMGIILIKKLIKGY